MAAACSQGATHAREATAAGQAPVNPPKAATQPASHAATQQASNAANSAFDAATADGAIDRGFKQWSESWIMDRYVPDSSHGVERALKDGTYLVRGFCAFTRGGGAPIKLPFAAAFTPAGGGYRLSNLCYADVTSGMRDCIDPSDPAAQAQRIAQSHEFLGRILILGLATAMDDSGPPPSSNANQGLLLQQQAHQRLVNDCNQFGSGCDRVPSYEITSERKFKLENGD